MWQINKITFTNNSIDKRVCYNIIIKRLNNKMVCYIFSRSLCSITWYHSFWAQTSIVFLCLICRGISRSSFYQQFFWLIVFKLLQWCLLAKFRVAQVEQHHLLDKTLFQLPCPQILRFQQQIHSIAYTHHSISRMVTILAFLSSLR